MLVACAELERRSVYLRFLEVSVKVELRNESLRLLSWHVVAQMWVLVEVFIEWTIIISQVL